MTRPIVVGIDGSDSAAAALRWAVRESTVRALPVRAVLAWAYLDQHHVAPDASFEPDYGEEDALAALDTYLLRAGVAAPTAIERATVNDLPARALLAEAAAAELLVLGARGLGGFRGAVLGSVSQRCVEHAPCPVVIVHGEGSTEEGTMRRIVVGVDGSENAQHALALALDEARVHGAEVQAVHAWHMPYVGGYPLGGPPIDHESITQGARQVLDAAVDRADVHGLAAPVERTLVEGGAAQALLDAAKGADLVVVGSRGLGGFAGLLLGSVSHQVLHHATCPVLVVPGA